MHPSSKHRPYHYITRPMPVLGLAGRLALAALLLCAISVFADDAVSAAPRQARIKDIASVEGIRDNQLVGYGIVVGLNGTGTVSRRLFRFRRCRRFC